MKGFLLICGLLASCVSGHMQMSKPFPIRSPLNKDAKGPKDWSYTNPLDGSGSDYPCKGYVDDPFHSVAEYSPGGEYEMELEGSATHGGGSCQLSLSYDKGKTFRVIHSMLGGCPIPKKYNFKIPEDAPSGKALFTWTWFNKIGNREMYMNCAQVTIKGGSSKREHPRDVSLVPRSSLSDHPPIFIANVDGPGHCTTIGGTEVNFPLPGASVEGSLSDKGYKCKGHAPFLGDGSSGSGSGSDSGSSSSSSSSSSHSPSTSEPTPTSTPSPSSSSANHPTPSSSASMTPSSSASMSPSSSSKIPSSFGSPSSAHVPATPAPGSCTSGELICADDGKSFSMCAHGTPVFMGPVAAGTLCKNGGIVHA